MEKNIIVNKIITKQPRIIKTKDDSKKFLDNNTKKSLYNKTKNVFSVKKLLCPFYY